MNRSEVEQLIVASTFFSMFMLGWRILHTRDLHFIFLAWNLFLAAVPYAISKYIINRIPVIASKWKFAIAGIAWLLFIPNSFYLVTDLFHLGEHHEIPAWFDLLLIVSFAWNGLLLGLLSVRQMEKIIDTKMLYRQGLIFVYPVMLLNAFGVYIGRYMRYNSWDIVTNPFHLLMDIFEVIMHPVYHKEAWAMVVCFSAFLMLLYMTLKKISKSIW